MGAQQVRPDINFQQYSEKFRATSQSCQAGPAEDRSCRDVCCLVTFIILTLFFIGVGALFMTGINETNLDKFHTFYKTLQLPSSNTSINTKVKHEANFYEHQFLANSPKDLHNKNYQTSHHQLTSPSPQKVAIQENHDFPDLLKAIPWIVLMSILALVLTFAVVILISKAPKAMIFGMLGLTALLIVAGIVVGIVLDMIGLTVFCIIFGVFWAIMVSVMFCCLRDKFQAAIVMLKVTGDFVQSKPTVLLAPIFVMFLSYLYLAFWLVSFIGIQLSRSPQSLNDFTVINGKGNKVQIQHTFDFYDGMSLFWFFLNIFYTYFLYYVMVFLIAIATALWYYGIEQNYLIKGLKLICNAHIGSLTFASMIVAIIQTLKNASDNRNGQQNGCAACCFCLLRCCLSFLEEIIKVLNHNAIIVMSVTGQDFVDSAKSAIYLIYNNFGLFVAVDMVQFLLNVCVMFVVILFPTGLGLILLKLTYSQAPNTQDLYLLFGTAIIFIICLLISMLIITVLSQSISCIFIFFCLDQRFKQQNFGITNRVPESLRELFNQIDSSGNNVGVNNLYRDSKQYDSVQYPRV